jgi:hypothetical protein
MQTFGWLVDILHAAEGEVIPEWADQREEKSVTSASLQSLQSDSG